MTRYGISKEGVNALTQLATDIGSINGEIEESGQVLTTAVEAIGDELGTYEDEIIDLVRNVKTAQEKGRDSAEHLSGEISKMASDVEELVNSGLQ